MKTVSLLSIVQGIAALTNGDVTSASPAGAARWVHFINRRLHQAWRFDFWPDLLTCEQRAYRDLYAAGTTYAAPTATAAREVYYPPARKYYQALKETTGNAPATLSATTYVVNSAYWAECASSYSGNAWATGTAYTVATIVLNPEDDRYYACHTAHTAGASFDATKFGILTEFMAYVATAQTGKTVLGEIAGLYLRNPEVNRRGAGSIQFALSARGVVPVGCQPPLVWVEWRRRAPVLTFTAWASGTAYAVGAVAYSASTGECYTAIQAGTNHAVTDTAYWEKNDIPEIFAEFLTQAAYADALRPEGKAEQAGPEDRTGLSFLLAAHDAVFAGQGQFDTASVQTY